MLLPRLYIIAAPILERKSTGTRNESIARQRTIRESIAATAIYEGISLRYNDLISVTTPDIPLMKHCLPVIFLISVTAFIVSSDEVVLSKRATIIVESPLKRAS